MEIIMNDKEITKAIYNCLDKYFNQQRQYACIKELRCGTGYSGLNTRRIDYMTISTNAGNETTLFEVKASRADFLKDIKDVEKQKQARCFASRFYYVAPKDLIKKEEVPVWAGLIEYIHDEITPTFQWTLNAPSLDHLGPTWGLVAAVIRNKQNSDISKLVADEKRRLRQEVYNEKARIENEVQRIKRAIEYKIIYLKEKIGSSTADADIILQSKIDILEDVLKNDI